MTNLGAVPASLAYDAQPNLTESSVSAVSWGAVIGGAFDQSERRRDSDEVYFRDTAHGFLVWAVAAVVTAAFLTSAASSIVGSGAKLAAAGAVGVKALGATSGLDTPDHQSAAPALNQGPTAIPGAYLADSLFRTDREGSDTSIATRQEAGRVMAQGLQAGSLTPADRTYLASMIGRQTGLSATDAALRVDAVFAQGKSMAADAEVAARNAADTARSAAAKTSFWTFVALLIGAFCASLAATFGGRQRDSIRHTTDY